MSGVVSAGILLYRRRTGSLEVLLAHPGGPYYAGKDAGEWSIPKGVPEADELDLEAVARREFAEETGYQIVGPLASLGTVTQRSGKVVYAWTGPGDLDPSSAHSNLFTLEWPPRSGVMQSFPEVDRLAWLDLAAARVKIKAAQIPLLERLEAKLTGRQTLK
jgi:predicted NUDIX family NTP pyrophosphohydrolase